MEECYVIKTKYEPIYRFFVSYWSFIMKYWGKGNDSEVYDEMASDIIAMLQEFKVPSFCENILDITYKFIGEAKESYEDIKAFYSEWWTYINTHFELKDNPLCWEQFMQDTASISTKYKGSQYCLEIIYAFVNYKAH